MFDHSVMIIFVVAVLQPSLFDSDAVVPEDVPPLVPGPERQRLGLGAWVDYLPAWIPGSLEAFGVLAETVLWRAERRPMYDRIVDVPRLVAFYGEGETLPHPLLADVMRAIDDRYMPELGEPLCTVGLCYYRDGRDSVAWHGDTLGRGATEDTIVAILSLGAERRFLIRPKGGGPSLRFEVGHGDLLVMGGSSQRTYEHAVPKTARPVGPRISIQYRARGVR